MRAGGEGRGDSRSFGMVSEATELPIWLTVSRASLVCVWCVSDFGYCLVGK